MKIHLQSPPGGCGAQRRARPEAHPALKWEHPEGRALVGVCDVRFVSQGAVIARACPRHNIGGCERERSSTHVCVWLWGLANCASKSPSPDRETAADSAVQEWQVTGHQNKHTFGCLWRETVAEASVLCGSSIRHGRMAWETGVAQTCALNNPRCRYGRLKPGNKGV